MNTVERFRKRSVELGMEPALADKLASIENQSLRAAILKVFVNNDVLTVERLEALTWDDLAAMRGLGSKIQRAISDLRLVPIKHINRHKYLDVPLNEALECVESVSLRTRMGNILSAEGIQTADRFIELTVEDLSGLHQAGGRMVDIFITMQKTLFKHRQGAHNEYAHEIYRTIRRINKALRFHHFTADGLTELLSIGAVRETTLVSSDSGVKLAMACAYNTYAFKLPAPYMNEHQLRLTMVSNDHTSVIKQDGINFHAEIVDLSYIYGGYVYNPVFQECHRGLEIRNFLFDLERKLDQ